MPEHQLWGGKWFITSASTGCGLRLAGHHIFDEINYFHFKTLFLIVLSSNVITGSRHSVVVPSPSQDLLVWPQTVDCWGSIHKPFFVLRYSKMGQISCSVCPWQAFPD
jgi:hypothetical protein